MVVERVPDRNLDPPETPWCEHAALDDAYRMIDQWQDESETGLASAERMAMASELAEILIRHGGYEDKCVAGCFDGED